MPHADNSPMFSANIEDGIKYVVELTKERIKAKPPMKGKSELDHGARFSDYTDESPQGGISEIIRARRRARHGW